MALDILSRPGCGLCRGRHDDAGFTRCCHHLWCISFFSALYFATLGALDVAFIEAAVGAVITTVFFVTAIF